MKMQLNATHMIRIRDDLLESSLDENEIRLIKGLGDRFIASAETKVDTRSYLEVVSVKVDGKEYKIYSRIQPNDS